MIEDRNKIATWMMAKGYATGHGDSIGDLLEELEWQIRESEREACAKIVEESSLPDSYSEPCLALIADDIRARGNT